MINEIAILYRDNPLHMSKDLRPRNTIVCEEAVNGAITVDIEWRH